MTTFATIGFKADVTGLKQAEKGLDNLARKGETSERRINKSVDKVNTNFMTLKSTIGLAGVALTAIGSSRIASEIIKQSDAWKNINSQIRQVTNSEEELISVRGKLVNLSKNTRSELTNTVDLYAQLNRSTKDLGVTEGELLNITKTLNNLFVAGGKPISEVSGAIRQLSQGFAAGALRGDEFNSVAEGAPKIMDALAAKLKMTRGELRAFAATGGITAEIMVNALKDYEQVAQKLADQTTKTFGQAMENATTNITKFVGEAEVLNSAVDNIGSGIENLSGQLGNISNDIAMWTGQWQGFADDANEAINSTESNFRQQFLALGAITDETMKFLGNAFLSLPANIRAMTKILAVELGFVISVLSAKARLILDTLASPFAAIPATVEAHITAFGNVLGARLAGIVEKAKIYGLQIKDALNPFDGDTFDHKKALKEAEKLANDMSNAYLKAADDQIDAATRARDEQIATAIETADVKIQYANMARDSVITSIMAERDATLSVYSEVKTESNKKTKSIIDNSNKITKAVKKQNKEIDEWAKMSELAADRLDQAFESVWSNMFNGFESMKDSLINSFKQMIAQMIHQATTKKILLSLGIGDGGGAGATAGKGMLDSLGLASIASKIPMAAAIYTASSWLSKQLGGDGTIGGLLGGLTGGLFGSSYKPKDTRLDLGVSSAGASGSTTLIEKGRKSLFRGSKTRTTETALDVDAINSIFDSMKASILDAAKLFDITEVKTTIADSFGALGKFIDDDTKRWLDGSSTVVTKSVEEFINGFSTSMSVSIKDMSEEEVQQTISEWVAKTTNGMVDAVFGGMLDEFKKEGELSSDTLDRIVSNFNAFSAVSERLNLNFGLVGKEAAIASTNIVELAGGLDNLASLSSQYYQSFFSEQEQLAQLTEGLNTSFNELGLSIPATRDGFRALIEGLDLTTESGQEMFATLMQLVPGLDAYYNAIKNGQTNAINDAMAAIRESVSLEKERANVILQSSRDAFSAEMSRIETQRSAVLANQSAAEAVLDNAKSALSSAFESRKSGLQSVISSMSALATRLSGAASVNNNDVAGALSKARKGDFSSAQTLSGQLPSANEFSSAAAFRVAQATAKNQLKSIADLASGRASSAQSQIAALDRQYNQLVGINDNTLSLNDAITQYQEAQLALDGLNTEELLNQLSIQEEAAIALLDIAEQNYLDEITRLDLIVENAQVQIDLLNGISENTLTTAQAIEALNAAILQAQTVTVDNPVANPSPVDPVKAEENEALMRQMNKNTKKTAEILQRMELGGLDTRVIA